MDYSFPPTLSLEDIFLGSSAKIQYGISQGRYSVTIRLHLVEAMTPKSTSPGPTSPTGAIQTSDDAALVRYDVSLLTPEDFYLFNEGSHYRIYDKLGAHLIESGGT